MFYYTCVIFRLPHHSEEPWSIYKQLDIYPALLKSFVLFEPMRCKISSGPEGAPMVLPGCTVWACSLDNDPSGRASAPCLIVKDSTDFTDTGRRDWVNRGLKSSGQWLDGLKLLPLKHVSNHLHKVTGDFQKRWLKFQTNALKCHANTLGLVQQLLSESYWHWMQASFLLPASQLPGTEKKLVKGQWKEKLN